jgi:hypothetical protein
MLKIVKILTIKNLKQKKFFYRKQKFTIKIEIENIFYPIE